MSQKIATIIVALVIIGLFVLDRDRKARTSKALWIPFIYVVIICSRPISEWMGITPPTDALYGNGIYSSPIDANVSFALLALGLLILIVRRGKVGPLIWRS